MNPKPALRIMLVLPWSPIGIAGAERSVTTLANELASTFSLKVVAVSPSPIDPAGILSSSIEFENVIAPHARNSIRGLATSIKAFRPNIIVGNVSHLSSSLLVAKILARSRARFVAVNHGTDMNSLVEVLHVYVTYLFSDVYVVVSQGIKDLLHLRLGLQGPKIALIYNGLDMTQLAQRANEELEAGARVWNEGLKTVVGVGRLVGQKSFHILLKAARAYRDAYKERINVVLVGDGALATDLRLCAQSLGIERDVYFIGWKDNPLPYVKAADVFVLSSYFEGFGNVIIEALACGTPVVSTNCPSGPSEILKDGEYGTLVPVDDYQAMARAINEMLNEETDRDGLRARASEFSAKAMGQGYTDLFLRLGESS